MTRNSECAQAKRTIEPQSSLPRRPPRRPATYSIWGAPPEPPCNRRCMLPSGWHIDISAKARNPQGNSWHGRHLQALPQRAKDDTSPPINFAVGRRQACQCKLPVNAELHLPRTKSPHTSKHHTRFGQDPISGMLVLGNIIKRALGHPFAPR